MGTPVLHVVALDRSWATADLRELVGCELADVEAELTCVTPIAANDEAAAAPVIAELAAALAATGRPPSAIVLARLHGAHATALVLAGRDHGGDPSAAYVVDRARAALSPFGRLREPPLVVNARHAAFRAACDGDPRVAGSHLARLVLLQYHLLDDDRSHALFAHALAALGVTA